MKLYDYKKFDALWQEKWKTDNIYNTPRLPGEKKAYVLDMFPYPSGEGLHVGHPKGYIATDIYSRFKRMNGYDVLHPMGWDAFGLPAEQYALKNKVNPSVSTAKNVARYKTQLEKLGVDYDWKREINTTDPEFYKWTQWIFTKLYEKGLAYESHEPINWCPSCKTGLANEDVNADGTCERCDTPVEKKPLRQWVLKITDYADRMIEDLSLLNWPEGVKTAQKNWIGRSEGSVFNFALSPTTQTSADHADQIPTSVDVFTTRADTLFGVTFIAISAELASVWFDKGIIAGGDVKKYIIDTLEDAKKENDYSVIPEKTGIFSGIYAINPATKEKIPVWIANYVVGGVGTGALMAVPAHDERDYEFAQKYSLPVKEVVSKHFIMDGDNKEQVDKETIVKRVVDPIIRDEDGNFYVIKEPNGDIHFAGGGIDGDETEEEALKREIIEETGFSNFVIIKKVVQPISVWGFRHTKQKNQRSIGPAYEVVLKNKDRVHSEIEEGKHELVIMKKEDVLKTISWAHHRYLFEQYLQGIFAYTDDGVLINSTSAFDSLTSDEATTKIIEAFGGKKVVRYKLQDWVFARQRYWGEPFPVVRDDKGKVYMVDESELPVLLPEVEKYEPTGTGESPLAEIESWANVTGYITDKGTFKQSPAGTNFYRETNTMPQWAGSSWYYLRFLDPHNENALVDPEIEKAWGAVNVYVGGDHATRHLIYARFWHKFLYDIGVVSTSEPFSRLEFLGFILAEDGRKMSKRWGNIINPDDVVNEYGADTLRVYEMFMEPFEQTASWSTSSIKGSDKFLDKVYALSKKISETSTIESELHKTVKKVGEDIEQFKFNTAVSAMMILSNTMESGTFTKGDYQTFLKLLAPFAPHITEQLWSEIGESGSIHISSWPTYDESKLFDSTVTLAIQIAGKMRGTIVIARDSEDPLVMDAVKNHEMYQKYVGKQEPKKVIIVKNKIVNIVI